MTIEPLCKVRKFDMCILVCVIKRLFLAVFLCITIRVWSKATKLERPFLLACFSQYVVDTYLWNTSFTAVYICFFVTGILYTVTLFIFKNILAVSVSHTRLSKNNSFTVARKASTLKI